jgi:hypothetical protein
MPARPPEVPIGQHHRDPVAGRHVPLGKSTNRP